MKLPKQCVSKYFVDKDDENNTSMITHFYYCNTDHSNTIKESGSLDQITYVPESLFTNLLEKVQVQQGRKQTKKKSNLKSTRKTKKRTA